MPMILQCAGLYLLSRSTIINGNHYHLYLRVGKMELISVSSLWLGCLFAYLASDKQQLISLPFPKLLAWSLGCVAMSFSVWGFSHTYSVLVSCLLVIICVMTMWIMMVLLAAHFKGRSMWVSSFGFALFVSIMLVGVK